MADPIDSFDLLDRAGQVIGRVDGSRASTGEPVVRIVTASGKLVCELAGGEVGRLLILLGKLKDARR